MAQEQWTVCDRCDKRTKDYVNWSVRMEFTKVPGAKNEKHVDLCEACQASVWKFIKAKVGHES